jgi:hypothetical protein
MKKERLTERVGDGIRYKDGKYIVTCYPKNNNLSDVDEIAVKLCEFEDKIENGTLLELPCKAGDTVYVLDDFVCATDCEECEHFEEGWYDCPHECGKTKNGRKHPDCIKIEEINILFRTLLNYVAWGDFGKKAFITREEAEKALAKRRENEKN